MLCCSSFNLTDSQKKISSMKINGKDNARTPIKTKTTTKKNSLNRKEAPDAIVSSWEEEEIDFHKQFIEEDECFWLSSPACSSSPSSCFRDCKFASSIRLSVDDWLISWLSSVADSYLHLDINGEKKKQKNTEPEFQQVSLESEDSSDSDSYECCSKISIKNSLDYYEEPLFWPSAWKSDWSSPETWKCFSMSPRRGTTSSDSRRRSLEFGSGLSQCCSKNNKEMINFDGYSRKILTRKVDEKMEEESIETVMGLEEFDGHEGVELEFNGDVFSMDDDV